MTLKEQRNDGCEEGYIPLFIHCNASDISERSYDIISDIFSSVKVMAYYSSIEANPVNNENTNLQYMSISMINYWEEVEVLTSLRLKLLTSLNVWRKWIVKWAWPSDLSDIFSEAVRERLMANHSTIWLIFGEKAIFWLIFSVEEAEVLYLKPINTWLAIEISYYWLKYSWWRAMIFNDRLAWLIHWY